MVTVRRNAVALAGLVAAAGAWYLWPQHDRPQLVAGPTSVSYDADTKRLTAVVTIRNSGDRPIVASMTNDVFVDSQKQALNDRRQPQPWRREVGSKQETPVTFILEGETAVAVWNGVRLMEVTIDAVYDDGEGAKLNCHFSFMGRFYPQLKRIGTVSNGTSPRACRGR
jgi:hypothetical protein